MCTLRSISPVHFAKNEKKNNWIVSNNTHWMRSMWNAVFHSAEYNNSKWYSHSARSSVVFYVNTCDQIEKRAVYSFFLSRRIESKRHKCVCMCACDKWTIELWFLFFIGFDNGWTASSTSQYQKLSHFFFFSVTLTTFTWHSAVGTNANVWTELIILRLR